MKTRKSLKLNKEFYDKAAILEALTDFKEVCDGKIINDSFEIEIKPREDIENIEEEFCNYVLGLMKNNVLV